MINKDRVHQVYTNRESGNYVNYEITEDFIEVLPGIHVKQLSNDDDLLNKNYVADGYRKAILVKARAGAVVDIHYHLFHERFITLSGRVLEKVSGVTMTAGAIIDIKSMTDHELLYITDTEQLVLHY